MPGQEHAPQTQHQEEQPEEPVEAKDLSNPELDDDIEGVLDEIDDVLEANAEEFVRGFVQKGGQ
ncbi:MAG TPA: ubiquitin-like protein Pup [Candidatus Saccharimonadales bacterium]|nr:ubiquitin-like protein Pup [Candidatus Saccharimonadales bacterium]